MPPVLLGTACDQAPGAGWVSPGQLASCAASLNADVDLALACDATAEILGLLSFGAYGTATDTVRPIGMNGGCRCFPGRWADFGPSYSFFDFRTWGFGSWSCGCNAGRVLELQPPVAADGVSEVVVDGVVLDPSLYVVRDNLWLVRTDGHSWPCCCQNIGLPSTEPGTWSVTYSHGPGVPAGGKGAAQIFACEYVKAMAGKDCQLTGRIQSVNRDGVQAVVLDTQSFLSDHMTGITAVDLWLSGLRRWSPPRAGRLTGPNRLHGLVREG